MRHLSHVTARPVSRSASIDRTAQRVLAALSTFYAVTAAAWIADDRLSGRGRALLVLGLVVLIVITVRGVLGRLGAGDAVAGVATTAVMMLVNHDVGAAGIGIQGGPAYVFMACTGLIGTLVLRWRGFLLTAAAVASVYVGGRAWAAGSTGAWSGLDEVMTDLSAMSAAVFAMAAYRRAAARADAAAAAAARAEVAELRAGFAAEIEDERRRLLHDDVLTALVSIQYSSDPQGASRPAAAALAAIERFENFDLEHGDAGAAHDLRLDLDRIELDVDVHARSGVLAGVPPRVLDALAAATREALRNVQRHAGVDRAEVHVSRTDHLVTVVVRDAGAGFRPTEVSGFGISQSIRARMSAVGGDATIESRPGSGTAVLLRGPLEGDGREAHRLPSAFRPETEVGQRLGFIGSMTALASFGQVWVAARHAPDSPQPWLAALLAVVAMVAVVVLAVVVASRPPGRILLVTVVVGWNVLLVLGFAVAPEGALQDLRAWILAVACIPLFTLAFRVSWGALVVFSTTLALTTVAWVVRDPLVDLRDATDPVLQPIFYALAIGAVARGVRGAVRDAHRLEDQQHRRSLRRVATQTRLDLARGLPLRAELRDFLTRVRDLGAGDPEREHAAVLAAFSRDEIYLPAVLDDALRRQLAAVRAAGASVTIRPASDRLDTARVAALLRVALDPEQVRRATLTLPTLVQPETRLVVIPPLRPARSTELAETFPHGALSIRSDEDASEIVLADAVGVGRSDD